MRKINPPPVPAVQHGPSRAARILAGDTAKAAPWVAGGARHGVPEAQLRLGRMLLEGEGAPKDEAAALAWFERRAEPGAPRP